MEKAKRVSYQAKFKLKAINCAEQNGNREAGRQFGVSECNIRKWRKQKLALTKCCATRKKFTGPQKGRHSEVDRQVLEFVKERRRDGLSVTSDIIRDKAINVAKALGISRRIFKASRGWTDRFMRRTGLCLRRRTSICQKLPADFENKLTVFQRYVINIRKRGNFLLGQIGNADETPIWLDMPRNYTIAEKGSKQVPIKTTGYEKLRVTAMLGATADGRRLPPFLIFKLKTNPKNKANAHLFPKDVVIRNQANGWMTEELMIDWLQTVWGSRPGTGSSSNLQSILCLDAFRGHLIDKVKRKIRSLNSELVIPSGMTSVLQPMDVSVNKPFKSRLQVEYESWLSNPNRERTATGKIKRAPPHVVAQWVSVAWRGISTTIIERAFKKCSISNELDGSEDHLIYDAGSDDEPDEPDSDVAEADFTSSSESSSSDDDDSE